MRTSMSPLLRAAAIPVGSLVFALSAHAQGDAILPTIGGDGGSQFVARCPLGRVLTGFDLRVGDDVDALRPLCAVAFGPAELGVIEPYHSSFGGTGGGGDVRIVCQGDAPVVIGMLVGFEGGKFSYVNGIHLFCGKAATGRQYAEFPSAVFDGPPADAFRSSGKQFCPAGLVAVGASGRSGRWLDQLGLICGAPIITEPEPVPGSVRPQARVRPAPGTTLRPPLPICDLARQARARNSPAAPGLEAKCVAETSVKPTPRVKQPDGTTSKSTLTKCEAARVARARNSPAAPGLAAQCAAERPADATDIIVAAEEAMPAFQPDNKPNRINVRVRYRKELGFKAAHSDLATMGRATCLSFLLSVTAEQTAAQPAYALRISTDSPLQELQDYYVCTFVIPYVPLGRPLSVRLRVSPYEVLTPWIGGSDSKPPSEQQRTVLEPTRTVTLTTSQPGVTLNYQMVYALVTPH